jgi:hypothetical protein
MTAEVSGQRELVLVGSQSVFAYTDNVPAEVLISEGCDVWSKSHPEKLSVISETLGKGSPYHLANGVYVDPVDPGIILLPSC